MKHFIQDSLRELKHVVWPTHKETQKYFFLVVIILILFGLYLFIVSNIFSNVVVGLRDIFQWNSIQSTKELNTDFLDDIQISTGEVVPEEEKVFEENQTENTSEKPSASGADAQ